MASPCPVLSALLDALYLQHEEKLAIGTSKEIPDNVKADLDIKPVAWIDQVFDVALTYLPEPFVAQEGANGSDGEHAAEKNTQRAH